MPEKLLVIGGVAGGTSAASRARRINPDMEITIFEKGDFVSYGACDEPYFLSGEIDSWERLLVRSPQQFKEKQNINVRTHCEVMAISPQEKSITVFHRQTEKTETHKYDRLIIATGAKPRPCNLPGAEAANLFSLKFLDQAWALDEYIKARKPTRVVTIGAGFIAMEMAEAFTKRGLKNTVLHRSSRPGGNTEPEIAEWLLEELQKQGVTYIPACKPLRFELDDNNLIRAVVTDKGLFETDMVLWAAGVVPEVALATAAGVKMGPTGAIATDERMGTSIPGVFAAGDCCEVTHLISGRKIFTPLGDIANKQGWTAGENAAGGNALYKGAAGSMHFRCFDMEIGMTGLTEAQASEYGFNVLSCCIDHASRSHAQPGRKPIRIKLVADCNTRRLLGAQIAGREGAALRINTLAVALQAGLTIEEINRLDLAYAPPFSPVMDPFLLAARVLSKDIQS